ncbi:MAG: ABC transporter ATP-binding protein [Lysobacteraceae bacterium]|nr:MAG: ABC transporter ATP-binding protein [Xanthomonadaceae bacterium]
MNEPTLNMLNASKWYHQGNSRIAGLDQVSLQLLHGEFACLCGPSGSGKTTLLNVAGGLDQVESGQVIVDGEHLETMRPAQLSKLRLQRLGFVFQSLNLIPVLSARENVEFVMQMQGVAVSERRTRATEVLAQVGLAGLEDRRPGELSGGQQQRVAVARAIASRPALILADEPTANLDSKTASELMDLLLRINHEDRTTFLISTHDLRITSKAQRILNIKDGKLVSDSRQTEA